MTAFRTDRVAEILEARRGLQRLALESGERAYALSDVIGVVSVGDQVIINTSAVDLSLGTGGWHVVHWNLTLDQLSIIRAGHIMKARYTSEQHASLAIEEIYPEPDTDISQRLAGRKVLVAALHSQVGVAALAARSANPDVRIGYVMTDGAALPIALSDMVHAFRESGVINATVTAGQSFGGDFESTTPEAGVAGCFEYLGCDLVIVGMGPGIVGTGTQLGNTALECVGIINNLSAMGADVAFALRYSGAESRSRHQGISHHSETILRLLSAPAKIGVPAGQSVKAVRDSSSAVDVGAVMGVLKQDPRTPRSMGRGIDDDPLFYEFTVASVLALLQSPEL